MRRLNQRTLADRIDRIAEYDFTNHKVFGSAYWVFQDGMTFERCYGKGKLEEECVLTNRSVFRMASMTKPITAVAALILAERGALSLDDGIHRFLPEFENIQIKDDSGHAVSPVKCPTIRQLLTHTSGIGSVQEKLDGMTAADKRSVDATVAFLCQSGLDFEPGSQHYYSGFGAFDVLTKIIAQVSGMDYLQFLQKEIFLPCEMTDTTFVPSAHQQAGMVDMHQQVNGENAVFQMKENCVFEDFPCTHQLGGAGLISTLQDYSRFAKMLLHRGKAAKGTILKEHTFRQLCTPQVEEAIMPGTERWGLGVRVIAEDSDPYLPKGSFGWSGAYGTHFWIDPENRIAAVFMKNSKYDGGAGNESARNFEKAVYSSLDS